MTVWDFSEIYQTHRNKLVRALTIALGDVDLATDAVDEAFVRALARWDVVGTYGAPEAWVYRTAKNWATSRFRRLRLDRKYAPKIARPDAHIETATNPELAAAIRSLSNDHQNVVILRYFLDWPLKAVAEALEVSPGTIKSRTSRALAELQISLGDTDAI